MTALYRTRIRHVRTMPVRHEFEYRGYSWFVDLDDLPRLPMALRPFARFDTRDHFDRAPSLRAGIDAVLTDAGIDPRPLRVTALLGARVLGYVFNPLSLYWCHDADGAVRCIVAEVHNTYGGRHCYVLQPDSVGRAEVAKEFYVSPFNPVDGHYTIAAPEPSERLTVSVTLHRDGQIPFVASMHGQRIPATTRRTVGVLLATPLQPQLVAARIRWHGIRLWVRGLPVAPRPATPDPQTLTTTLSRIEPEVLR